MKKIDKPEMDLAFHRGFVYRITAVGTSLKEWHLELNVRQDSGKVERCIYVVRRTNAGKEQKVRYWSDLRRLIGFLDKEYGVIHGEFQISKHFKNHG